MNSIIITGSSSGLGKGLSDNLLKKGYDPIVTYNTNPKEIRGNQNAYHLNLASDSSIDAFCSKILTRYSYIDTIVCNAGVDYFHESFDDISIAEWRSVFEIKVFGHFQLIKSLLPVLQESNNPNIIFISASLADRPDPLDPVYSCASAAINTLAKSLVYSLKDFHIRSNIICPGPMDTNLSYWKTLKDRQEDIFSTLKSSNPLNLTVTPPDVADIIDSIVKSKILNGATIHATGGSHLR